MVNGTMMRPKMVRWLAPSTRAASMSSSGRPLWAWRRKKMVDAPNRAGRIKAQKLLYSPMVLKSMKRGMMVTCTGIIIEVRNRMKRMFLPAKLILAKA